MEDVPQYDNRVATVTVSLGAQETKGGAADNLSDTDQQTGDTDKSFGVSV
jgi:hypothetical protein